MIINIKNILHKILLPFFPEDRWLRKHWWHRYTKVIAIIITATSIYSVIWMSFLFFFLPQSWMNSPLYPPVYHLSYLIAYLPVNIISWLSQFRFYQILFHSMLPIPTIGPLAFVFILIAILYLTPSLLYRLAIYISQNFHLRKVKIILFTFLFCFGLFTFSTWKYQQLINEGSIISDQHCLNVNPLIIARKNSYINSIKIMVASGSADQYWTETNKYLDISKRYIEAEKIWLASEKSYTNKPDFKTFVPAYIQKGGQLQYDSYEAQMKATAAIVEFFETYKTTDAQKQKALSDTIINENKRSNDADNAYNNIANEPKRSFDLRDYFTSVPESKCPQENFNIPNVQDILNPQSIPTNIPLS